MCIGVPGQIRTIDGNQAKVDVCGIQRDVDLTLVGAVSAKNTIQLDFVGKPMEHTHTEVDRMLYASIRYEGIYDSTLLSSWAINTINAVSTAYTSV